MPSQSNALINLHDNTQLAARYPILIAHRGGVIAPNAPENSRQALTLAAEQGYDMVELDVRPARDGVPVLFHGVGGVGEMRVDCEASGRIGDFSAAELNQIHYRGTDQTILSLDEALSLCAAWGLGIMLDIKTIGLEPLPADFLKEIGKLLVEYGLLNATMTLSQRAEAEKHLPSTTLRPFRANTLAVSLAAIRAGSSASLAGRYWFDDPESITADQLHQLKNAGVLTIACINSFRYPQHSFDQLEGVHIQQMSEIPVDGYQIDSRFGHFFSKLRPLSATTDR